jgi:hypothetical protein
VDWKEEKEIEMVSTEDQEALSTERDLVERTKDKSVESDLANEDEEDTSPMSTFAQQDAQCRKFVLKHLQPSGGGSTGKHLTNLLSLVCIISSVMYIILTYWDHSFFDDCCIEFRASRF